MSSRTGQVANGKGKEGGEAMNEAGYQTLIVKFSEPITALDGIFDDAEAWGVETLKGWIEDYESSRMFWYCVYKSFASFNNFCCYTSY